jgi:hypothetical protein
MFATAAALALGAYATTKSVNTTAKPVGKVMPNATVPLATGGVAQYEATRKASKIGAYADKMGLLDFQLATGANPWFTKPQYPAAQPKVFPNPINNATQFYVDPGKWVPNYYTRFENFKRESQAESNNWQIGQLSYRLEPSGIRPYKYPVFVSDNCY